jgi:uncharacterized membrane protein
VSQPAAGRQRATAIRLNRIVLWGSRHWLALANVTAGLFVLGAVLAPALMRAGLTAPATALYTLYGFTCHQFSQRSYFLFGRQLMYPLDQLVDNWPEASNMWQQRAIVGDPVFGYKVALANRCSAIYPSILAAGLLFGLLRKAVKPISIFVFALLALPMALDGGTHLVGEITGLNFRLENVWLQELTRNTFAPDFYVGDSIGSFNWLMRTLTGALFGIGLVWFTYPHLRAGFDDTRDAIVRKFNKAEIVASSEAQDKAPLK